MLLYNTGCVEAGLPWHSGVWCVELSGGNVGGERVWGEEERGRKGTACVGIFERNSSTVASPTALID